MDNELGASKVCSNIDNKMLVDISCIVIFCLISGAFSLVSATEWVKGKQMEDVVTIKNSYVLFVFSVYIFLAISVCKSSLYIQQCAFLAFPLYYVCFISLLLIVNEINMLDMKR